MVMHCAIALLYIIVFILDPKEVYNKLIAMKIFSSVYFHLERLHSNN